MSLEAGDLKHRVLIQSRGTSKDSDGDTVETWTDFATLWAACEPVSVRDFIASRAPQSEIAVRFKVRYRDDLLASMRIVHRGAAYNIAGVLPDKDSGLEYLTLPCTAGVNLG